MKTIVTLLCLCFCVFANAQTTITGNIVDESLEPVLGANVIVVGGLVGAVTDFDGNFTLTVEMDPPFEIQISSVGYRTVNHQVTENNQSFTITLLEGSILDEVVISASRTPERIFESPVTVERMGIREIRNTASADFYGNIENLKGVDVNTNSLTFRSVNTRGFATFANNRFMQLADGMDTSAPALNFPLGNLLGMTELDVHSIELLPGAASALYGANAFNGIIFMRSKSPFEFEGISVYFKQGMTSQTAAGDNSYTDFGIRVAHKFTEHFAAKVNFSSLSGTDWAANNAADKLNRGLDRSDIDYDGVNIYGDEVSTDIKDVALALVDLGILPKGADALVPSVNVSRTGYLEGDLTDYKAESVKADWGLFFRPWANDLEIAYVGKVGTGSTIYQGTNRYAIDNLFLQQHKIEIRNDNFFVRGYLTEDNAGDSYDMVFTGINVNRSWKDDQTWFGEYVGAFVQGSLGGLLPEQAHILARQTAETGRFEPGSEEFKAAFNKSINDPDLTKGSKFQDNSKIYHADANYNFSHLWDFADIQVGGSYRNYELNSSGTIYTDKEGPINYNEIGVYTQLQKKFMEDERLKLTASIRYDKSELFDGFFSPRIALGYNAGANQNHNIRASFQTGFRNPTTQDLYIGLDAGRAILVGSAPDNPARDIRMYNLSPFGQSILGMGTIQFDGQGAYNNSFFATSVSNFGESGDATQLEIANSEFVKPEEVTSFEVGYRGKINRVVIDFSVYHNTYKDFLSNEFVIAPFYGDVQLTQNIPGTETPLAVAAIANGDFQLYQTYTNSDADVKSYGGAIGITTRIFGNFDLGGNYTYAYLDFDTEANPDFRTSFNTPEHKVKATFGNANLFENFGFNVAWRWSDTYFWEATFGDGVVPAFNVVDAQINFRAPKLLKSTFKVGASNLLADEYFTAFGTGLIGSIYYVSWTINNL